jgi:hypothetical protein
MTPVLISDFRPAPKEDHELLVSVIAQGMDTGEPMQEAIERVFGLCVFKYDADKLMVVRRTLVHNCVEYFLVGIGTNQ